jgi:hypothetical protein
MTYAHITPSAVYFFCPGCTHTLRVEAALAGCHTTCPACAIPVTVPTAPQPALDAARPPARPCTPHPGR